MTYSMRLHNDNSFYAVEELGTMKDMSDSMIMEWFSKAYTLGILPKNPQYTDEIRLVELDTDRIVKVWRLAWIEVDKKADEVEVVQ